MNREIKFRAWDKSCNKMRGISGLQDCFSLRSDGVCNEDYILMQYTGLKDKNGTEIYEGDIIKISLYDDEWKTKVRDYCGTLIIDVEGCDWNTTALSFLDDEALCEVIGNIYETQSSE